MPVTSFIETQSGRFFPFFHFEKARGSGHKKDVVGGNSTAGVDEKRGRGRRAVPHPGLIKKEMSSTVAFVGSRDAC